MFCTPDHSFCATLGEETEGLWYNGHFDIVFMNGSSNRAREHHFAEG